MSPDATGLEFPSSPNTRAIPQDARPYIVRHIQWRREQSQRSLSARLRVPHATIAVSANETRSTAISFAGLRELSAKALRPPGSPRTIAAPLSLRASGLQNLIEGGSQA